MIRLVTPLVLLIASSPLAAQEWKSLWNGKDFDGWEKYLGAPKKGEKALGVNNDPKNVYTIVTVDGKPAIRISGEIWGALTTLEEFENYHLKFEFKWGEKRWPPRENTVRDSGLLYHCVGEHGKQGGLWMKSFELQIQEHDCGDFHSLVGATIDIEAEKNAKGALVYKKGAPMMKGVKSRVIKNPDAEKPTGEWNTVECVCLGPTAYHIVNGKVNMILHNLRHTVDGKEVPLTKGKLQFQSESAEVYYRNLAIRPITKVPAEFAGQ